MKFFHKLSALLMALLVLVPVCGCGKALFIPVSQQEASCCPCGDSHDDDEDNDCQSLCRNAFIYEARQFLVEDKTFSLELDQDEDASLHQACNKLNAPHHYTLVTQETLIDPPWDDESPKWKLFCNYRL